MLSDNEALNYLVDNHSTFSDVKILDSINLLTDTVGNVATLIYIIMLFLILIFFYEKIKVLMGVFK